MDKIDNLYSKVQYIIKKFVILKNENLKYKEELNSCKVYIRSKDKEIIKLKKIISEFNNLKSRYEKAKTSIDLLISKIENLK